MLRQRLVKRLKKKGAIFSPEVEAAFLTVERHRFLPNIPPNLVYKDRVIPTKWNENRQAISSSSQPTIMAIMLEQLGLTPGQHVLEIGAGTGYNAALMASMVGEEGHITTLDIDEDIVQAAREHLDAAQVTNVEVICTDGVNGYAENAPYDRIILTVSASDVAPAWWAQLQGRLVLPLILSPSLQQLSLALEPQSDYLQSLSAVGCGFMPLRGEFAPLTPQIPDMTGWLAQGFTKLPAYLEISAYEAEMLMLWLSLHEPERFVVLPSGPSLTGYNKAPYATFGLLDETGLVVLDRIEDNPAYPGFYKPFTVNYRLYGNAPHPRLKSLINAWEAAGRPPTRTMNVRVYPHGYAAKPGEVVSPRRWHDLVITWKK